MAFNLDTCRSKDELETFAQEMFGVELDKRQKLDELKTQIKELIGGNQKALKEDEPKPLKQAPSPEKGFPGKKAAANKTAEKPIQWVFNQNTESLVMYYDKLKERLGVDLIPCHQDGSPL